jgi:hypothetical protein
MKKSWLIAAILLAATLLGACAPKQQNRDRSSADQSSIAQSVNDSLKPISEVLANHTPGWMNIPGVMGTGEGQKDGKPTILIFVDSLTDSLKQRLPVNVEGYSVMVKENGRVVAHPKS